MNFALIGVGGFVAPRHLQAIKNTRNTLLCALDKHDSVGILDSYFPQADFFTESERFERHINKLYHSGAGLDFISICSPNHLHDSHIRLALRNGAHAICEKPLVLNPWNLTALLEEQKQSARHIYTILQLRLHPSIIALKQRVQERLAREPSALFDITLTYITARGKWYFHSWKGDPAKSGGVASNIGVHFFDMLLWIFGACRESIVHIHSDHTASGLLYLESARVRWFLSIDESTLPPHARDKRVFRELRLDDEAFHFSDGFSDLHTRSYEEILSGRGFGCEDCLPSIELIHSIRNATPIGVKGEHHPKAQV